MKGKTLSHYRILDEIGRGGMGVVYKAEDTKLDRTVALKLLPPHALVSEDDRARFYREARAAAALSHPNIAHIYEIDEANVTSDSGGETRPFIAMEYIDGDTLGERIAQGPLPLKDCVSIATQIAEGLRAAHDKGIVHRDIKSGNIMMTTDGVVKVLDFGLAKTAASTKLTQMGSTLGTVSYMSPEQAKGEEVDRRSDIWSLGVILYEMIAGTLPFPGDYEQAIVYGILNEDPDSLTTLRAGVPLAMDGIIAKMLAKDPSLRYQHVDELPADLKAIDLGSTVRTSKITTSISSSGIAAGLAASSPAAVAGVPRPGFVGALRKSWPVLLLVAAAMFGVGWLLKPQAEITSPLRKVLLTFPGLQSIGFPDISIEGRWLSFAGSDTSGAGGIFLYEMATGSVLRIPGSEQYNYGQFSPDGRKLLLAGWTNAGAATMVVPNGVPNVIVGSGNWHLWETDDTVVYTGFSDDGPGIYRATLGASEPELVAAADTSVAWAVQPYVDGPLPGGKLLGGMQANDGTRHVVAVLDPKSKKWTIGEEGVANASYAGRGYVTYQVGNDLGKLVVRPISTKTGAFTGSPREVLPAMRWGGYNVGSDGSLVFVPDLISADGESQLFVVSMDPPSITNLNVELSDEISRPSVSPDGEDVALEIAPARGGDRFIAVYDMARGVMSQRTFAGSRRYPRWSPDGQWLYYHSEDNAIMRRPADGSGQEELVLASAVMPDVAPDGQRLLAVTAEGSGTDLVAFDLQTKRTASIDSAEGNQLHPDVSPSGRFVAFRTFAANEERIAVRPLEGAGYWVVSGMNGNRPRWSPDERFIYFVSTGQGIYRIAVSTERGFRTIGEPQRIATTYGEADFDISPDGKNLIVAGTGVSLHEGARTAATLGWWQNWVQSLPKNSDL